MDKPFTIIFKFGNMCNIKSICATVCFCLPAVSCPGRAQNTPATANVPIRTTFPTTPAMLRREDNPAYGKPFILTVQGSSCRRLRAGVFVPASSCRREGYLHATRRLKLPWAPAKPCRTTRSSSAACPSTKDRTGSLHLSLPSLARITIRARSLRHGAGL